MKMDSENEKKIYIELPNPRFQPSDATRADVMLKDHIWGIKINVIPQMDSQNEWGSGKKIR